MPCAATQSQLGMTDAIELVDESDSGGEDNGEPQNIIVASRTAENNNTPLVLIPSNITGNAMPVVYMPYPLYLNLTRLPPAETTGMYVNHFPGSLELGRKDKLCTNILRMQRKFTGAFYQIIPETFVTGAKECKPFMAALASSSKALWILKPPNQCCGRGIKIISGGSDYTYEPDKRYVAQVTSFDPLRVYLFDNGLVRFCTHKYSTSTKDVTNRFGHLTNYSVNKKNKAAFQSNQDAAADGEGSKWSYQALQAYFETQGLDPTAIHLDIAALIVKTLMCVESPLVASLNKQAKHVNACFELFGFDVLLDANLRPWLLEVNVFPSMSSSSPMDKRIKSILVCDTFQLVRVHTYAK
ncbi:hypothetical protein DYB30_002188 [Aphanomyces astaci]|uniref:Tubulin--tyrosine ligase-like protein 5 n=1 Tax=Aphanomyces astaci TaxID=112090 RepID=A0A397DJ56_APHAT|nr:hypothetical protein DYB30_002188 [Aphanomyces astaci]